MAPHTRNAQRPTLLPAPTPSGGEQLTPRQIASFRRALMAWYRAQARTLPWRGIHDPYRTWVSEIMLQQTRVAAVIERYNEFISRFPTVVALALASEQQVLAAWSGLGYYRRARLLHRAAQFLLAEREGQLPTTAAALRTLPGVGLYTSAAIASIAFGEPVAVVDGNVERVLLRVTGQAETPAAVQSRQLAELAQQLIPARWGNPAGDGRDNPPGNHNQAMMELGATLCLPRAPLCAACPVHSLCRTRGEHQTTPRAALRSKSAAYLLRLRKRGAMTEVLLYRRPADASLMAGMLELPPLHPEAVAEREPTLRLRHAITQTNYYVGIYAPRTMRDPALARALQGNRDALAWFATSRLSQLPLTGLARKALRRLGVMSIGEVVLEADKPAGTRHAQVSRLQLGWEEEDFLDEL
ncbi:MAG: A/G-specific adenine glycosylase [Acidobacteriota bacterium]|nr:A/G-specific adenine glycosylase [Acidobacteriota bacterium]